MAVSRVIYFVKFFSHEKYADDFVTGKLYMNRLRYFRELEDADGIADGRLDTTEAIGWWWQPNDIKITISVPQIGEIHIDKTDLAGPVSGALAFYDDLHLLCMSAIAIDMGTKGQDEADFKGKVIAQLRIDERCLSFGPYAVVVQAAPFVARLKQVFQRRGHWFKGRLVDYYDEETFHGTFAQNDVPFKKQKRFAYQSEYRVCVQTNAPGNDPIIVDAGDISAFSAKIEAAKVNAAFSRAQLELQPKR